MAKYRKKPVVVEAEVYSLGMEDGFDCFAYEPWNISPCKFLCGNGEGYRNECKTEFRARPFLKTRQGKVYISKGDMIITQSDGERYPCNSVNFKQTYELVKG